ncbi:hypothetical protein IBX73_00350, partial [candidate division WOR-3 bacterium]|nr:hypothetical protein [candidate division WOR-3 bacterium]
AICVRAADYLAKAGKYDEAINYYLQANAHKKMIAIINEVGAEYTSQGRCGVLCGYIEQIPAAVRERNQDLLITYARALNILGRLKDSRQNLLKALRILKEKRGARCGQAEVLYALGGISTTEGKFASAMRYYRDALRMCPRGSNLTRASILNSLGSLHTARGGRDLVRAVRYFEEAFNIAQRKGYGGIEASILNNWAMSEWKMGNLNAAHAKISRITSVLAQHFTPGCGAGFYNAAKLSLLVGREQEASAILDSGVKTCSPYNDLWSLVVLWTGYGLLYLDRGDLEKAKQHVGHALKAAEELGVERLIIVALTELCKIETEMQNHAEADGAVSRIWLLKKARDDAESIPAHLAEAKLKLSQGRFEHAEQILVHAGSLAVRFGDVFHQFLINMESSKLFNLTGDAKRCCEVLREAVSLSREKGYDHLLARELKRQPWTVQAIREHDIEQDYVRSMIKQSKTGMHWIDAYLFGVPRVSIDGRPIEDDTWPTIKTKKLFFYLLQHYDEKVSSDRLVDVLWPGASATKGSASLRKAMQYIREVTGSVLGNNEELVSAVRGLYEIAPAISIDLDTSVFDTLYKNVRDSKDDTERVELLQKAIAIGRKDFAAGWYDDWTEELRRYYRGKCEECLVMMAELYCRRKEYSEAVKVCETLTTINPLDETYHRLLMRALARLGEYRDVEQVYQRLRKNLRRELDVEPGKETAELYESLMRSATGN